MFWVGRNALQFLSSYLKLLCAKIRRVGESQIYEQTIRFYFRASVDSVSTKEVQIIWCDSQNLLICSVYSARRIDAFLAIVLQSDSDLVFPSTGGLNRPCRERVPKFVKLGARPSHRCCESGSNRACYVSGEACARRILVALFCRALIPL